MSSRSASRGSGKPRHRIDPRFDASEETTAGPQQQPSQAETDISFGRALRDLRERGEIRGVTTSRRVRRDQIAWLTRQRDEMEARLEKLGLPRNCWRELHIYPVGGLKEPDPFREVNISWPQRELDVPLRDFVTSEGARARRERHSGNEDAAKAAALRASRAFWNAASAWAADYALVTRSPEVRLRVGRYMEAFRAFLRFPEWGEQLARQAFASAARLRQANERQKMEPVWKAFEGEYRRLRADGHGPNSAAESILKDPAIRERIQQVAKRHRVKPWRGDTFYSLGAIRKRASVLEKSMRLT